MVEDPRTQLVLASASSSEPPPPQAVSQAATLMIRMGFSRERRLNIMPPVFARETANQRIRN